MGTGVRICKSGLLTGNENIYSIIADIMLSMVYIIGREAERDFMSEKKTNNIQCQNCRYSVAVNSNERVWLCDNPNLKTFCKNVKHGSKFSCGYGRHCKESEELNDEL